jgi:predicted AAA+ superfamily ATPase
LNIRKKYNIPEMEFKDILKNKILLIKEYSEVYNYFDEYLEYGGVLYHKEGFVEALENSIRKVILQDLSALRDINIKYENEIYKLLYLVAKSPPYEVNYSSISRELEISKTLSIRIIKDLENSGLIIPIFPCKKIGIDIVKEPKIYLTIPLRKFFLKQGIEVNKGSLREEFFVNHLRDLCYIKGKRGEKTSDFKFKDIIIEVGGPSKGNYQNPDYIATDSLSIEGNKVPLFLFGLLY